LEQVKANPAVLTVVDIAAIIAAARAVSRRGGSYSAEEPPRAGPLMLSTWLLGTPLESFLDAHLETSEPFVQAGTAACAVPLLDWTTLARLLDARADVMVVRNGALRERPPADLAEARVLFDEGCSLVFRGCDAHDSGLRELATSFEREVGGEAAVQAFVTPASFRSFGWHYDCEDVFIAQTSGSKEYRLRRNTVNPAPTLDAMPANMHFERETSRQVLSCTLVAGDWLYIPRGWWHVGRAISDSLSISVGVLTPAARGSRPPREAGARRAWETVPAK